MSGPQTTPWPVEVGLRWALAAVVAFALTGVPLALAGWFRPLPVAVAWVGALVAVLRLWPAPPRHTAPRPSWWAAAAALAVIAGVTALNALHPAQPLVVSRDPGVYLTTGIALAEEGDLRPDGLVGPFAAAAAGEDPVALEAGGPGFYEWDAGDDLRPQFFHLFPALLAVGRWIGGDWLLLRVNPLLGALGLVAVWALGARLLRPWFATAAVAAVALTLPQVWFSRSPFTEPLTQALVFGSLLLYDAARRRPRLGLAAGLTFGVALMTRVDVLLLAAPFGLVLVADRLAAGRSSAEAAASRHRIGGFVAGAVVPGLIGWADVLLVAPTYVADLGSQVVALAALVAVVAIGGWLAVRHHATVARVGRRLVPHQRRLAVAAAGGAVAVALAGWLVRPHLQEVEQVRALERGRVLVEFLQRAEGQEVAGWRTYDEDILPRLASYVGPATLAAAVAGTALVAYRLVTGRARRWLAPVAVAGTATALYLWRMSITADQIWALRRYVPVTIPLLALLAAAFAQWLWRRRSPAGLTTAGRTASLALLGAAVAFPAAVLAPLADAAEQEPMFDHVHQMCQRLGPDAAVLFLTPTGEARQEPLVQSVQVVCDVPVAVAAAGVDRATVDRLDRAWEDAGRRLVLVFAEPAEPDWVTETAGVALLVEARVPMLEATLSRRPERLVDLPVQRWTLDVRRHGR